MNVFAYRICATAARTELLFSLEELGSHKIELVIRKYLKLHKKIGANKPLKYE
jgi:hypothetical protein